MTTVPDQIIIHNFFVIATNEVAAVISWIKEKVFPFPLSINRKVVQDYYLNTFDKSQSILLKGRYVTKVFNVHLPLTTAYTEGVDKVVNEIRYTYLGHL